MAACLTAPAALDRYFFEMRCKIIEIAANLDRIDRGAVAAGAPAGRGVQENIRDPRLAQLREALQALLEPGPGRAEKCQMIFSLPYVESWNKKQ